MALLQKDETILMINNSSVHVWKQSPNGLRLLTWSPDIKIKSPFPCVQRGPLWVSVAIIVWMYITLHYSKPLQCLSHNLSQYFPEKQWPSLRFCNILNLNSTFAWILFSIYFCESGLWVTKVGIHLDLTTTNVATSPNCDFVLSFLQQKCSQKW